MSQERIIRLLKKHYKKCKERWFTAKDLEKRLNLSNSAITKNLGSLRQSKLIMFKIVKISLPRTRHNVFNYRYKIR